VVKKRQGYNHLKVSCVEKWSLKIFACRNSKVGLRSKYKTLIYQKYRWEWKAWVWVVKEEFCDLLRKTSVWWFVASTLTLQMMPTMLFIDGEVLLIFELQIWQLEIAIVRWAKQSIQICTLSKPGDHSNLCKTEKNECCRDYLLCK
jgi:hypothetical protein